MSLKLVGVFAEGRKSTGLTGEQLAQFRVFGGTGSWKSIYDYAAIIEKEGDLPAASSQSRNRVWAAVVGIKHKFGVEMANGAIETYDLYRFGFKDFE